MIFIQRAFFTTRYIGLLFLAAVLSISSYAHSSETFKTEQFQFTSDGHVLDGIISRPIDYPAESLVIIVHGYGPTNVVSQNWHYDIRSKFTALGIAVVVWDKPGCGKSEGEFNINQPIISSADEVISAIKALRDKDIAGSKRIGLWGISRAGWIAPVTMQKEPSIRFWISVSGTDALENWGYLLKSNLALAGHSHSEIKTLYAEWNKGNQVYRTGGSYEEYMHSTQALRKNDMYQRLTGQKYTHFKQGSDDYKHENDEYLRFQKTFMEENNEFDSSTGLRVYVPNFTALLDRIHAPVLAIFGGNDRNVDWQKTKALYQNTIGRNPQASLDIKVFPQADHTIRMSKTGGHIESRQANYWKIPYADGYYQVMTDWLCLKGFCRVSNEYPASTGQSSKVN